MLYDSIPPSLLSADVKKLRFLRLLSTVCIYVVNNEYERCHVALSMPHSSVYAQLAHTSGLDRSTEYSSIGHPSRWLKLALDGRDMGLFHWCKAPAGTSHHDRFRTVLK
jgi:hypothetical protein